MAFAQQVSINRQGTLAPGTVTLYAPANGYNGVIQGMTFNSAVANTLTIVVNKINPISSITAYAFTLTAGDVICDNSIYQLKTGESISITTTAAVTNYFYQGIENYTF